MTAYIKTLPCDLCGSRRMVRAEPPYDVCANSLYGDMEPLDEMTGEGCSKLAAVEELSDMAVDVAERWRVRIRHTTPEVRDEQVRGFADMLSEWASDIGAEFDADEWIADCAPVRKARAA
jgi:hypothetical protein